MAFGRVIVLQHLVDLIKPFVGDLRHFLRALVDSGWRGGASRRDAGDRCRAGSRRVPRDGNTATPRCSLTVSTKISTPGNLHLFHLLHEALVDIGGNASRATVGDVAVLVEGAEVEAQWGTSIFWSGKSMPAASSAPRARSRARGDHSRTAPDGPGAAARGVTPRRTGVHQTDGFRDARGSSMLGGSARLPVRVLPPGPGSPPRPSITSSRILLSRSIFKSDNSLRLSIIAPLRSGDH